MAKGKSPILTFEKTNKQTHCNQEVRRTQFYLKKKTKQTNIKQINKQTNQPTKIVRQKVRTRFLLFKKITW